jgi:hypothetical protein
MSSCNHMYYASEKFDSLFFSLCWFSLMTLSLLVEQLNKFKRKWCIVLFQTYDGSRGGGDVNDSSRRPDDVGGGTEGGGKQEITGNLSCDNRAVTSGHGMC